MRFKSSLRYLPLLATCACSRSEPKARLVDSPPPPSATSVAHADSHPARAIVRDACPATGEWAVCSVVYRLDRTGLIPVLDSLGVTHEPKLTRSGKKIAIGSRADLAVYLYPDKKSREADEAHLDKTQFLGADDAQTMEGKRTLIDNENLLAILTSRDDHQRERVVNALESGPPQPAKP